LKVSGRPLSEQTTPGRHAACHVGASGAQHQSGSRRCTTESPFALPTRGAGMPPV